MLSPRVLVVLAIFATLAAALPTDKPDIPKPITNITEDELEDTPWFSFPLFGNLFAPLWRLLPSFGQIGPKIITDDNKFQVAVHVKDFNKDDLKVKIKGDFIFVQGSHEAKHDDRDVFASQFFHTYTLPVNSSGDDVTADLSTDGYLIVTAPLNGPSLRAKDIERVVPIKEIGTPFLNEEKTTTALGVTKTEKTPEPTTDKIREPTTDKIREPTTEKVREATTEKIQEPPTEKVREPTTEKDREPTTPSNRDAITDKDNIIPHGGNEIIP